MLWGPAKNFNNKLRRYLFHINKKFEAVLNVPHAKNLFKPTNPEKLMELQKTAYTIIISSLVLIILLFTYLNIRQSSVSAETESEELETCRSLIYNGEDRIDLLFLASEEDTKRFSDTILNTPPYSENKDYFNVFFIPPSEYEPTCEDYKGIAILCNTKENLEAARSCPNDYIIVVKDYPINIRSSAFTNVISINKNHEDTVIIHEFGHTYGNLAEEYVIASLPRNAKNCVSSCDKFSAPIDSCNIECSKTNLYRSINNGVMRTLATSNYGQYNIYLLNKLLEKDKPSEPLITGSQIFEYTECKNKNVVAIDVTENNAKLSSELLQGCAPNNAGAGEICIKSNGEELCYPETVFTDSQDMSTEEVISGEQFISDITTLYLERTTTGQTATIILNGNEIATISLEQAGATACVV